MIQAAQIAHDSWDIRFFEATIGTATVIGNGGWMDDMILHDGLIVKDGHIALPDKPGLGIELNADVVKAHLASGEKYWT